MKKNWVLFLFPLLLLVSCGKTNQRDYEPRYKSQWNDVEKYIHNNWHTTIVDSVKRSWVKRGLVLPHSYMGCGVNNHTFFYWDNYFRLYSMICLK